MTDNSSSKTFYASAPGKVILFGEHGVVYGTGAVACAIDRRLKVSVTLTSSGLVVEPSQTFMKVFVRDIHLLRNSDVPAHARVCLLCMKKLGINGAYVKIASKIPLGAGLGSSAALCTALAGAFYQAHEYLETKQFDSSEDRLAAVWRLAHEAESIFHGSPSGVDTTVTCYGNCVLFSSVQDWRFLRNMEDRHVFVVDTGVTRSTSGLVARVKGLKDKYPTVFGTLVASIGEIVKAAAAVIEGGGATLSSMEPLMSANQGALYAIGASHPKLEEAITLLTRRGMAAKLTGAGGGGCAIALLAIPGDAKITAHTDDALKDVDAAGFSAFTCKFERIGLKTWQSE